MVQAPSRQTLEAGSTSNDDLKHDEAQVERLDDLLHEDVQVTAMALTPEEQRKVWRKIDRRIIWPMALIYLLYVYTVYELWGTSH